MYFVDESGVVAMGRFDGGEVASPKVDVAGAKAYAAMKAELALKAKEAWENVSPEVKAARVANQIAFEERAKAAKAGMKG